MTSHASNGTGCMPDAAMSGRLTQLCCSCCHKGLFASCCLRVASLQSYAPGISWRGLAVGLIMTHGPPDTCMTSMATELQALNRTRAKAGWRRPSRSHCCSQALFADKLFFQSLSSGPRGKPNRALALRRRENNGCDSTTLPFPCAPGPGTNSIADSTSH